MFIILLTIAVGIYLLIKKQYSYWEQTNIPHVETQIPYGVLKPIVQQKRAFGLIIYDLYKASPEKILGIYLFFKPFILVRDAQLARQIVTSDFGSFHDRGLYVDEKHDPLSANLFTLPGQGWRTLRAKLTPSFTSGKLKGMFDTIDDVGSKLVDYLNRELKGSESSKVFEMKDLMTTYAVDIIGSVIFGLEVDSFQIQTMNITKLMVRLGYRDPTAENMLKIMTHTINLREQNKIVRKDLLQLLIQLRNTGKISEDDDKIWDVETAAENLKAMSLEVISSNAFLFYIAGSSFTIYELSMYPELLKTAQTEVLEVLERHNIKPSDKFTYEALQDMKFLELCIMETTRKYPGLAFLNRECTQDFEVPDTKYVIKKGTPILISLFGLHRDPEYFPDPMRYNPERFLDESKSFDPVAYMPFGEGPRHCIAQRMGKMNSKLAVAKVLANFHIETRKREELEFIFHVAPVLLPKNGLNVRLSKLKS